MKKNRSLFFTFIILLFFNKTSIYASEKPLWIHNEVVGTFLFEQFSDDLLLLTAMVEKKHFTNALKKEGDCAPKDMMRVCGNKYLLENFEVSINSQEVQLKEESLSIEKDYVVMTYTIAIPKTTIKDIKVTSDYMFKYNAHSISKVVFELSGRPRVFNIKNKKRAIIAKF